MKLLKKSLFVFVLLLSFVLVGCDKTLSEVLKEGLNDAYIELNENKDLNNIIEDVTFVNGNDKSLEYNWSSSNEEVMSNEGKVNRPSSDTLVTITLKVSKDGYLVSKEFGLRVLKGEEVNPGPIDPDKNTYAILHEVLDSARIDLKNNAGFNYITSDVRFVNGNNKDVTYTWTSNNLFAMTSNGSVIRGTTDQKVVITLTVSLDGLTLSENFSFTVLAKEQESQDDSYTYDLAGKRSKYKPSDLPVVYEEAHYSHYLDLVSYIYHFKHLPDNYYTKSEIHSASGSDKYVGGDTFLNKEGHLPKNGSYIELDVDYSSHKNRGTNRIVYNRNNFDIYWTTNHYRSFTYMIGAKAC